MPYILNKKYKMTGSFVVKIDIIILSLYKMC